MSLLDRGVKFTATARGLTSGWTAQAKFTDAPLPSNVQLRQWETKPTGNWITGNLGTNNSDYEEGETVPFQLDVGGLSTSGNPYTFSVCRDFQSGTKRGYLFLAPFNTRRAAAPGGTITSTNGPFSGVNVTVNSVTEVGGQGTCGAGERQTMVSINSTGNATAFVLWGGHLAAPSDVFEGQPVGPGNGAASFPMNFHMNLLSPNKSVTINPGAVKPAKAAPALSTTASGSVAAGGEGADVAHLTLGTNPTGTISFTLYSDAGCTGSVFTSSATVNGNGDYSSGNFTANEAGTYHWRASYSGDPNNNPAGPTACADPAEAVVVAKASPTVTTSATPQATAGGTISDQATLAGGVGPTGTITFTVFGPNDATCSGTPTSGGSATVSGNGTYPSSAVPVTQAGTYRWIASYSGDANNNPAGPTACADPAEAVVVTKATPALATTPTPTSGTVGVTLNDAATLSGGSSPTGSITFTLYDPDQATCTGTPRFTQTVTVTGYGTYSTTGGFVTDKPGTWRWTASYSGDASNNPASTGCNDEQVAIGKVTPALTTTASGSVAAGGQVSDVAHLTLGTNPTGTISFTLYSDAGCTVSVFTSSATVSGNGDYASGSFTATQAGTYHWRASYSGDGNNNAAGPTACADPADAVVVTKASPQVTTGAHA